MKKVKSKLVMVMAISVLTVACKKKTNNDTTPTPDPTPSPVVAETHFIPANFNDANGILYISNLITKTTTSSSFSIFSSLYGQARFTLVPNNFSAMSSAGTVSVNTSVCSQQTDSSYTTFSNFLSGNPNAAWKVSGNSLMPALNFSVKTPTVETGNTTIQVTKSAGYVFNFSNITNKDCVSVYITTPFSSSVTVSTIEKKYLYSAGSASFSPSELAALPTGTCNLVVKCNKYYKDTVGGKYFYFNNFTQFTQNVMVN